MQSPLSNHSANTDGNTPPPRLVGWKEIAAYFGKAERTVKRWEQDRNLPIYRVPGGSSASVYAYPAGLKKWLEAGHTGQLESDSARGDDSSHSESWFEAPVPDAPDPILANHASSAISRTRNRGWVVAAVGLIAVASVSSILLFGSAGLRMPNSFRGLFRRGPSKSASDVANPVSDAEKAQAHDFYLKGRYEWNQRTAESLNRALDFFTQAIVHDPNNAQAYAGLADTYDLLREYSTMPDAVVFPRAIAAAKKAVALDDSFSEAHRALAFAEMYGTWDFVDAEKEFRRAIELNPNDPQAHRWYANAIAVPGRFPEALREINIAQELDPSSNATLADKGWMLFNAGQPEEGIEILKEVESSAPGFRSPHFYLMLISFSRSDYPAFLAEGQKSAEIVRDPVMADIIAAAQAGYAKSGSHGLMNRLYARQKEYYEEGKLEPMMLARTSIRMGRRQEALQLLEEAYNRHEANVFACLSHPDFLELKDDPRYKALVKKINFPTGTGETSPTYLAEFAKRPLQSPANSR